MVSKCLCLDTVRIVVLQRMFTDLRYDTTVDGFQQRIECSQLKLVEIMDEVERIARWRGGTADPFEMLREERKSHLGL